MLGAVRGTNPATGSGWDDTKRYVDALDLSADEQRRIFEHNARRVYPRLDVALGAPTA
jgi:4-oxalmesaconate hydratase